MARLVVVTEGLAGLSIELGGNPASIGRANGNAFQIIETSVSGRHCEVVLRGSELHVRDLRSTNGTFVQGQKITDAVLKPGQTFRLGQVDVRFEVPVPAAPASVAPKASVVPAAAPPPVFPKSSAAPVLPPVVPKSVAAAPVIPKPVVPVVPRVTNPVAAPKPVVPPAPVVPVVTSVPIIPPPPSAPVAPITSVAAEPGKKVHVLFVDDNEEFLATFGELCSVLSDDAWEIYSAPTADRALSTLQKFPIDLVVLDITMPMVDGIQLLGIINRRYAGIKIAVLTGTVSEANRATCLASGADLFIEKPFSPEGFKVVFNMLNDLVSWTHREGFSGTVRQVGLQEVIQMECLGRHSSVLEIRNLQTHGQIYIESGAIVHATTGAASGEKALQKLLALAGGQFKLQPFAPPEARTVQGSWEFLLMEAARVRDEETDTQIRTKASLIAAAKTPAQPLLAPGAEIKIPSPVPEPKPVDAPDEPSLHALGDDIVVVATYDGKDGKWNPNDGSKK